MGSELVAAGLGWMVGALAGFSLGSAAAWTWKAVSARKKGLDRRSRIAVSLILLSLSAAVAGGAALLVIPPKALLAEASLWNWAAAFLLAGCLTVLFPRWWGIPSTVLALTALGLLTSEAAAWHSLVPAREAARFIPYMAAESGVSGNLSVPDRNAVPVLSRISLAASECALEARVMEFKGPLASLFGPRRYVLSGFRDGDGGVLLDFPGKAGPLGFLLRSPETRWIWLETRTLRSEVLPLSENQSISWTFTPDGELAASTVQ